MRLKLQDNHNHRCNIRVRNRTSSKSRKRRNKTMNYENNNTMTRSLFRAATQNWISYYEKRNLITHRRNDKVSEYLCHKQNKRNKDYNCESRHSCFLFVLILKMSLFVSYKSKKKGIDYLLSFRISVLNQDYYQKNVLTR